MDRCCRRRFHLHLLPFPKWSEQFSHFKQNRFSLPLPIGVRYSVLLCMPLITIINLCDFQYGKKIIRVRFLRLHLFHSNPFDVFCYLFVVDVEVVQVPDCLHYYCPIIMIIIIGGWWWWCGWLWYILYTSNDQSPKLNCRHLPGP